MQGLMHPDILSLEGVWVNISMKAARLFDSLKDLLEEIETFYKNAQWMQKVSAPALPSLRSYLDELARIDQALPDKIAGDAPLVHMWKRTQQAKTVTDFLVFQGTPFVLDEVEDFMLVMQEIPVLADFEIAEASDRLATALLDQDSAIVETPSTSTPSLKSKVVSAVRKTAKSAEERKSSSSVAGPTTTVGALPLSSSSSSLASGAIVTESKGSPRPNNEKSSPATAPRVPQLGGPRRQTRVGSQVIATAAASSSVLSSSSSSSPVATQEYVQNAIAEAVAPLLAEIERLKALVGEK